MFFFKLKPKYCIIRESNELTDKYVNTGYLTLQTWIDNIILKTYINNATFTPKVASVRVEAYKKDNIGIYLQGQAKVFLVLPLILPYLKMIFRLLYEKVLIIRNKNRFNIFFRKKKLEKV